MDQRNRDRPGIQPISHQNVKLKKGRHTEPARGACVVEVASMLAGEPFSDHPRSVCPMLGAYMRAVNDRLDDEERQRLLPYAAAIVGTARPRALTRARVAACARWSRQLGETSALGSLLLSWGGSLDRLATICVQGALRQGTPLALADVLIEIGQEGERSPAYGAASDSPVPAR